MSTSEQIPSEQQDTYFGSTSGYGDKKSQHLLNAFTIWFSKKLSCDKFETALKEVGSFDTLQNFVAAYAHMPRPSTLTGTNTFIFIRSVKPLWEEYPDAGHWLLSLNKGVVDRCWENLAFALIGGQFPVDDQEIMGISVQIRKMEDWLTIWNRTGNHAELVNQIGSFVRATLRLPDHIEMIYRGNRTCLQQTAKIQGKIPWLKSVTEKKRW